ncbi:centrosomal protein of 295 kDa-like [Castor canadensis]|uniref:Centrosomal protein of 295 kDa-like n=1 Tax=Castor canadensis TaxID=51338 RepID=A0AC58L5V0_CASCN
MNLVLYKKWNHQQVADLLHQETESGRGIMEEPELTLVSTSDISIAEADFANLTLEENRENETKSFVQVGEFLPLLSETPDCPAVSENKPTGNLQEPFVKRKKSLMEKAFQRQKEIQSKTVNFQPCTASYRLYDQLAEVKMLKTEQEQKNFTRKH